MSNNNSIGILFFSFQHFISNSIFIIIIIENSIVFKNVVTGTSEKAFDLSKYLEIYIGIGGHKKFGCHTLCFYSSCPWALPVNHFSQLSENTSQFDLYPTLKSSFIWKKKDCNIQNTDLHWKHNVYMNLWHKIMLNSLSMVMYRIRKNILSLCAW